MSFFFSCKYKKFKNALKKLGLSIKEGAKHTKAECVSNGRKTTIPRHNNIKKEIVQSICNFLLEKNFKEEELSKLLK